MPKLFKIFFRNRKTLVLIFGLVLFLSLIPLPFFAQAAPERPDIIYACDRCGLAPWRLGYCLLCIFLYIVTLGPRFAVAMIAAGLFIIALAAGLVTFLVIGLLNWIITASLAVEIIRSPLVMTGWTFSRDFVNMFFILILVFIGLATILKIREYEAKKILPLLIIIALLINFSPVFVGFIVDMGNILTRFFIDAAGGGVGWGVFNDAWDKSFPLLEMVWGIFLELDFLPAIGEAIAVAVYGIILLLFFLFSVLIYFVIMFVFFARILILWLLTILAPLAFACYILPATRKWWNQWWQQLIQWSTIGIPIGFFLYLSNYLMTRVDISGILGKPIFGEVGAGGIGIEFIAILITALITPTFGLFVLYIGVLLSFQMAPSSARGIINFAKSTPGRIAKTRIGASVLGTTAGLTTKSLGGMSKGAQWLEAKAANLPGGKIWSKPFTRPLSWATRGIETAATPALLEYQSKTRKVSDEELKKIDKMAPADAEKYINATTEMLPEGLRKQQKIQYMARMAEDETLEFTSSDFQKEAADLKAEIREKENPYYQKEAAAIAKALPETVGEEELVHSKLVGMPNKTPEDKKARKEKENEIRKEIKETQDIMQDRIGEENFTIEAALRLKYVTKNDVNTNRKAALTEIRRRAVLAPGELEKTQRNIAASATFTKQLKPEDIKKMIDPDDFATRVGITLGNPRNIQKVLDNFGMKKLKAVVEKSGGLDDATATPDKLDQYTKTHSGMVRTLFTSPAYREIEFKGRKNMRDTYGQSTASFDVYGRRIRVQEELDKAPRTLRSFNDLHATADGLQRRIEELQMRGQPTAAKEEQLEGTLQQIASKWELIEKSERLRNKWIEIEKMRHPEQARVLQRDVEAGLRIEGILNTEPLLWRFDNLHRIAEKHTQKKMKAAREGRHSAALYWSDREKSAIERISLMEDKINRDNNLRKQWEEVENLRRPPK